MGCNSKRSKGLSRVEKVRIVGSRGLMLVVANTKEKINPAKEGLPIR